MNLNHPHRRRPGLGLIALALLAGMGDGYPDFGGPRGPEPVPPTPPVFPKDAEAAMAAAEAKRRRKAWKRERDARRAAAGKRP